MRHMHTFCIFLIFFVQIRGQGLRNQFGSNFVDDRRLEQKLNKNCQQDVSTILSTRISDFKLLQSFFNSTDLTPFEVSIFYLPYLCSLDDLKSQNFKRGQKVMNGNYECFDQMINILPKNVKNLIQIRYQPGIYHNTYVPIQSFFFESLSKGTPYPNLAFDSSTVDIVSVDGQINIIVNFNNNSIKFFQPNSNIYALELLKKKLEGRNGLIRFNGINKSFNSFIGQINKQGPNIFNKYPIWKILSCLKLLKYNGNQQKNQIYHSNFMRHYKYLFDLFINKKKDVSTGNSIFD